MLHCLDMYLMFLDSYVHACVRTDDLEIPIAEAGLGWQARRRDEELLLPLVQSSSDTWRRAMLG